MQKKIIAVAVMLGLQLAAGAVQAEGHKKGSAAAPVAEHAPASKANPRYVINGGEVYDKKTDLTWQRCSVGQHWKGDVGCVGIAKSFTFGEAQALVGGGWRVPSLEELRTLIGFKRNEDDNVCDGIAFPDLPHNLNYWSSTIEDASNAWYVSMPGEVGKFTTWHTYSVRLVRSGQ